MNKIWLIVFGVTSSLVSNESTQRVCEVAEFRQRQLQEIYLALQEIKTEAEQQKRQKLWAVREECSAKCTLLKQYNCDLGFWLEHRPKD